MMSSLLAPWLTTPLDIADPIEVLQDKRRMEMYTYIESDIGAQNQTLDLNLRLNRLQERYLMQKRKRNRRVSSLKIMLQTQLYLLGMDATSQLRMFSLIMVSTGNRVRKVLVQGFKDLARSLIDWVIDRSKFFPLASIGSGLFHLFQQILKRLKI